MKKVLPIVLISFQDHSANLEGRSDPYQFLAIGVIIEETEDGYVIGHWIRQNQKVRLSDIGEITSYVAKVKGLKMRKIGSIKVDK